MPQRPQLVELGVQDAEEVVVVAGDDDQLMVWQSYWDLSRQRAGACDTLGVAMYRLKLVNRLHASQGAVAR